MDTDFWPIVILTAPPKPGASWIDRALRDVFGLLRRGEPFVLIVDARQVTTIPGIDVRRATAEWSYAHIRPGGAHLGFVVVSSSTAVRFAVRAIHWALPPMSHIIDRKSTRLNSSH